MNEASKKSADAARRKFLTDIVGAGGVGLMALDVGLFARQSAALPATAIRPPGALPEDDFLGACIRCGLCVRDCPYDTLRLSKPGEPVPTGTPYFVAREVPCEMCEDIPCVAACPSGALDRKLEKIDDARMGLAVLIDQENCIAFQGLRCEVCFNVCPIRGKAITLEYEHNRRSGKHARFLPEVHSNACTGCGKCEEACILEEAAIKVLPVHLAKGELGHHYRLGWKEKQRAGGALVSPDQPHHYNLPKNLDCDLQGQGLLKKEGDKEVPYSSNPLDTLNRKGGL